MLHNQNHPKLGSDQLLKKQTLLVISSCLLCILLGFLLLGVFEATGETTAALKHLGLGLILIPALAVGIVTNFMNKFEQ